MRDAFVKELMRLARSNPRIYLITGDLGFGVLERFEREFPRQYLNAGVAEQNMTGLATGLALEGRVVFTYSIANFPLLRCLEQVRNDACYHNANVKIVSIGSGFSYGSLGASHHATEDLSIARAIPNLTVVSPGDDWEAAEATAALVKLQGPALLRLDRAPVASTQLPDEVFILGKPRVVRAGSDITLVTSGAMLRLALSAADTLVNEGISCRVLHYHTVKPLEIDQLLYAAKETGGIMTLEEHTVLGGFGGAVAESILEAGARPGFFYRLGLRSGFSKVVGSQEYLRQVYGLDVPAICAKVRELLQAGHAPLAAQVAN
ncbi:MAG: transketolase [Proteobacteria bacterium]|nr:transketolase [Pseudomonadota bacterium]